MLSYMSTVEGAEFTYHMAEKRLTVHVDKVGGGTIGKKYVGRWNVKVIRDGVVVLDDIFTNGTAKTHSGVAWAILEMLGD